MIEENETPAKMRKYGVALLKEASFVSELLASLQGLSLEIGIGNLVEFGGSEVDSGRGGDDHGLNDSLEGDTVEAVGPSDQKEAGLELLEEDDSLSSESPGEENQDLASLDASSEFSGSWGLAGSPEVSSFIVGGVWRLKLGVVWLGWHSGAG